MSHPTRASRASTPTARRLRLAEALGAACSEYYRATYRRVAEGLGVAAAEVDQQLLVAERRLRRRLLHALRGGR